MIPPEIGQVATDPQEIQNLLNADYQQCRNQRCDFYVNPEHINSIWNEWGEQSGFTCPRCTMKYGFLDPEPFGNTQNPANGAFKPGGTTLAGVGLDTQGNIGEELVRQLPEIPGYGKVSWYPDTYHSPLDGIVGDWGIEVKTITKDAANQRFISGRPSEKASKNLMAAERGLKGILGLLIVLDYQKSVADVYAREMPLDPQALQDPDRVHLAGIKHFRTQQADVSKLVTEIPFKNPLLDPNSIEPQPFYQGNSDIPF